MFDISKIGNDVFVRPVTVGEAIDKISRLVSCYKKEAPYRTYISSLNAVTDMLPSPWYKTNPFGHRSLYSVVKKAIDQLKKDYYRIDNM